MKTTLSNISKLTTMNGQQLCDFDNRIDFVKYVKALKLPIIKVTTDELYNMEVSFQKFGCTDYVDHRKDTKTALAKLILSDRNDMYQAITFIKNGKLASKLAVVGYRGGYTAALVF